MTIHCCVRCGHEWASKKIDLPRSCAKCKQRYWWRSARIPKPQIDPGKVGAKLMFPQLENLLPGESCVMPFQRSANQAEDMKHNARFQRAVDYLVRSKGWKVHTRGVGNNFHALRVL